MNQNALGIKFVFSIHGNIKDLAHSDFPGTDDLYFRMGSELVGIQGNKILQGGICFGFQMSFRKCNMLPSQRPSCGICAMRFCTRLNKTGCDGLLFCTPFCRSRISRFQNPYPRTGIFERVHGASVNPPQIGATAVL